MQLKILVSTVCNGKPVKAGSVIEAEGSDARYLVITGKAVEYTEPAPKARAKKKSPVNRMIDSTELDNRDAG